MRRVRIDRLTKRSRNARIFAWAVRTGEPVMIVRRDGSSMALVTPVGFMGAVPSSEEWFWEEPWQTGERHVDELVAKGKVTAFANADEFVDDLKPDGQPLAAVLADIAATPIPATELADWDDNPLTTDLLEERTHDREREDPEVSG